MKLFSLVTIYNQSKFEKELDMSLTEPNKNEGEESEFLHKETINPSILSPGHVDLQINKSELLLHVPLDKEDEKLKYQEFYSFKTIKDLYCNQKLLISSSKSKDT